MVWRWTSYQVALAVVGVVVFGFAAKSLADDAAVVMAVDMLPLQPSAEPVVQPARPSTGKLSGYDVILVPRDGRGSPRALTERGWTAVRPYARQRSAQQQFDAGRRYYGGAQGPNGRQAYGYSDRYSGQPNTQRTTPYRSAPEWRGNRLGWDPRRDVPDWRYRQDYARSADDGAAYRARGY